MSIKVKIPSYLRHFTNDTEVVEVNEGTVGKCLNHLVKQFPSMNKQLFSKNGKLYAYIIIFVNGESAYPENLHKPVRDGDEIRIAVVIGGG